MVFNNSDVRPQWKEAWQAKEEALKARYVRTLESLSEHVQPLPMLDVGDPVMIQNQSGRFPKKWDKSGVVVEKKGNDQHVVKVDGSGRLTLRNRRFLRKYESHGKHHARLSDAYAQSAAGARNHETMSVLAKQTTNPRQIPSATAQDAVEPPQNLPPDSPVYDTSGQEQEPPLQSTNCPPVSKQRTPPRKPSLMTSAPDVAPPAVVPGEQGRPKRERKQRRVYDPSTGKSAAPQPVPEDI